MMGAATLTKPGPRRRRASVYIAVLGAAMIVTVIGLSAVTAIRVQRRGAEGTNDLGAARLYAQAAIELGMQWIENDPEWRGARGEGVWAVDMPIGEGTFSLEANDLGQHQHLQSSSASDPVLLTGTGVQGEARYKLQVTLAAEGQGLTCLEVALHAGNDLSFNAAFVQCDQTISANNNVIASGSEIYAQVEAGNAITGEFYSGKRTAGITPRTMPDGSVFDTYIVDGTAINIASIPSSQGKPTIEDVVLSPISNPYGAAVNDDGIYVIDCGGATLMIQNCRIVGTLVLLNPSSSSAVRESVSWEPAVANYPALLVAGTMGFAFTSTPLGESARSVNFNPTGAPYGTVEDDDLLDTYPSLISGLVYVSGDVATSNQCAFDGVLVVGVTLSATGSLDLKYQQTFLDNPPPGFGDPPRMVISPGSWKQAVDSGG